MKLSQYTVREARIISSDADGMRQRWMWGLRLLHDPQAFNAGSSQLAPGVREQLVQAAAKRGMRLSDSEIGYRLQCARAYSTEEEFARILANFSTWDALTKAGFKPSPAPFTDPPADEPPADWRTVTERSADLSRALADTLNGMDAMWPLSQFEPTVTTLADLRAYQDEQRILADKIHDGHLSAIDKRDKHWDRLAEAAGGDLDTTWQDAEDKLAEDEPDE